MLMLYSSPQQEEFGFDGQTISCLQWIPTDDQRYEGSAVVMGQDTPCSLNHPKHLLAGNSQQIHLPKIYGDWQPLSGSGNQFVYRKACNLWEANQMGREEQETRNQDKDNCLQSVHIEHVTGQQWMLDDLSPIHLSTPWPTCIVSLQSSTEAFLLAWMYIGWKMVKSLKMCYTVRSPLQGGPLEDKASLQECN